MTQEEFANRIGISQTYISMMERGKVEVGAEILLRISRMGIIDSGTESQSLGTDMRERA